MSLFEFCLSIYVNNEPTNFCFLQNFDLRFYYFEYIDSFDSFLIHYFLFRSKNKKYILYISCYISHIS